MISQKRIYLFILTLIAMAGLTLRLWGIGFGLPYQFHQDEPIVVNHALAYGTGDFNPHFFAIPPLTSYLLFFIYSIFFLIGNVCGLFQGTEDFALSFFKDPSVFYLIGRFFIGVVPAIVSILALYKLYKKFFLSHRGALFAASVFAFIPITVLDSHFIYTDMLFVLTIIMSMLGIKHVSERPSLRNYILCAFTIGLACAIKYNAALLLAPFIVAHMAKTSWRRFILNKNILIGFVVVIGTFVMANPYALLDSAAFIKAVRAQGAASSYQGWLHHARYSLLEGVGPSLLLMALAGLVLMFKKNKKLFFFLLIFPFLFYVHLVFLSQPFYRYVLAIVPFIALAAGYCFDHIFLKFKKGRKKVFFLIAMVALFIPALLKSMMLDSLMTSRDTRVEAAQWIEKTLPAQAAIALDHTFFRPTILQHEDQLKEKFGLTKDIKMARLKEKKLLLVLQAHKGKSTYFLYFLNDTVPAENEILSAQPVVAFDLKKIRSQGIRYVVINHTNRRHATEQFYRELKDSADLLASFSPYYDAKEDSYSFDRFASTSVPIASKELFRRIKTGPYLEIYKLKP